MLYPAEKLGYVFKGWSKELGSNSYITSISELTTGDITLYANYEYEVYKVDDEYKDKVRFVLISREQPDEEIKPYWQENGYTLPYSPQQDRVIYNLFATSRVPRVYVCKDGKMTSCYKDDPIPQYEDLLTDLLHIL